ncbi:hypothetical protein [Bacillus sp. FJAT-45066]|uniref:hypothetical protein n=1 Tax=Bacillus sp. FJAT-45066 TaxID=2011010 RepID=UPI000BB82932|nr:hypothetical protein [Bacillus sp. FJAT-45066]
MKQKRRKSREEDEVETQTSKNKVAFLKAVNEMILLYGNEITNKQFSNFLEIPSRVTSYRHITNLACSTIGFSKSRKYHLSLQNQYPILAQQ